MLLVSLELRKDINNIQMIVVKMVGVLMVIVSFFSGTLWLFKWLYMALDRFYLYFMSRRGPRVLCLFVNHICLF